MKKFNKYLAIAAAVLSVAFYSCDYVSNPYEPTKADAGAQNSSCVVYNQSSLSTPLPRKMLTEDYTGHKCDNCPKAARAAHKLHDSLYHENMVIVTVHAGSFATITPLATGEQFPTDMRTAVGDIYNNTSDFNIIANPFFMVNRAGVPTGDNYVSETGLGSALSSNNSLSPSFKLEVFNGYDTCNRILKTRVKATALTSITGKFNVTILFVEDSLVSEQLDKYVTPNYIPNYIHRDVLRDAVNSAWGDQVFSASTSIAANDTASVTPPNFAVSSSYNASHCKVVAFIYNNDQASPAYYEVLQVEEVKIK